MENFSLRKFDPSKSLFIEASAGTGKTYTIQLMVAKLISLGTPLKKILIVTYTEKAAGELKDRIRKKIDEVLDSKKLDKTDETQPEINDSTLALFAKAYQDVDNAAIFTIHSFCQKALKEYAYDAGRPFDMSMIDDSKAKFTILSNSSFATSGAMTPTFNFYSKTNLQNLLQTRLLRASKASPIPTKAAKTVMKLFRLTMPKESTFAGQF